MRAIATLAIALMTSPVFADSPVVEAVTASKSGETWTFSVTLSHADTGWDHYADGWEVAGPDGTQFGYRVLHHPHVNEQPFTRSLSGIEIPATVETVIIRAHDSVHEWGDPVEFNLN